jgi:mRNA interferase RelE/StbE
LTWTVRVSSQAEKYYRKLDKGARNRFKKALVSLSEYDDPPAHRGVKPLHGELRGFFRLRIGDYRVVFSLLREDRIIAVVNIFPRGDAY